MSKEFPDALLKSVSRSFYLSLRILPASVRSVMGLGYLLCRAADTIADQRLGSLLERRAALQKLDQLLRSFPLSTKKVEEFTASLPANLSIPPSAEGQLLTRFRDLMDLLNTFARTDQALLQQVAQGVIKGMDFDLQTFGDTPENVKALTTNKELETYIGWIGGEPGRFWTEVIFHHLWDPGLSNRDTLLQHGINFGKGLQMVNILRDVPADLKNGRCYLPEERLIEVRLTVNDLLDKNSNSAFLPLYHQLIDETIARLRHGFLYLEKLPKKFFRLRASIWWPLMIGLKTLGKLRKTPDILGASEIVKITRGEIYRLIALSVFILPFNKMLRDEVEFASETASSRI
ncbi:MAG: squalene/phytoene synthase family protein [Elusimicrobia bacterium]|nr:squalene/phytoene synthase family protein [Candidatus Obscuribacterium magneticum]